MSEEKQSYVELEEGSLLEFGTKNVPEMFSRDQFEYLAAMTGHSVLRELKGELLNIVEGCGMLERQETAVKRMVTSALHDWHYRFKADVELVMIKKERPPL